MSTPQGAAFHYRRMAPGELAARLAAGTAPPVYDLREPFEHATDGAGIAGAVPLPLSELHRWWPSLDPRAEMVFQCRAGNRSRALCCALAVHGFERVCDLEGGLEAWQAELGQG
ncbi:MAG: rhodanese-like domain-containing protein [Caldilineae bacterium]|nr:rhodanese-like domain-containing protein [Chloroflexota bacterium]MCB9177269.1 rhodanese-like domain-containing protein [Caldilineae bacterium]